MLATPRMSEILLDQQNMVETFDQTVDAMSAEMSAIQPPQHAEKAPPAVALSKGKKVSWPGSSNVKQEGQALTV